MTQPVLTIGSTITCGHPSPGAGGKLALDQAQDDVLKIDGNSVLVGSLENATIATGCSQIKTNAQPNNVPCTVASEQKTSPSTVLRVNGAFVLLHTTSGTTNGNPQNDWSSTDAKQDVLNAD
jgi:hypothetical protein